ncbi:MAG TPA: alginate export family protein [Methylomirabilota bacterium]|nr:alginate export family protein [Methylomirabilota bacterium]
MKKSLLALTSTALGLGGATTGLAQYAPPPPPQPFAGFLNEYLRQRDPYYSAWDLSGSARLRFELKENGLGLPANNDFRANGADNDNSYFSDKILLRAGYNAKWWSFLVEGRSSSTSGDDRTPAFETDDPADIHQAFFTVGNHKEFPLSAKIGRQEISYGDERLVGAFGWHNIGRVFDAAKLRWQHEWFAAELFTGKIVLPDDNALNGWNDYNQFSGLHVTTRQIPKTISEFYVFSRNDGVGSTRANPGAFAPFQVGAPTARDIYTFGARLRSATNALGRFDYTVEGAYQVGNWKPTNTSDRQDHNAYAVMANVGYTFADTVGKPRVAIEYAYGSGDDSATDDDHNTFDNLYPTNHKFYGYADYLSWQNLHDVRGIFQIRPTTRLSLAVEGHLFWLADTADNLYNVGGVPRTGGGVGTGTGFNRNPSYDSFVGGEVDVIAGYALTRFASLEAGYGHFFTGDYIDQSWANAGGSADAHWFYIQTMIRF